MTDLAAAPMLASLAWHSAGIRFLSCGLLVACQLHGSRTRHARTLAGSLPGITEIFDPAAITMAEDPRDDLAASSFQFADAIRLRPIALTAGATMLGSAVITLDPIFSGLTWAFIFGIFASTAFTLIVVPLIYYLVYRNRSASGQSAPRTSE